MNIKRRKTEQRSLLVTHAGQNIRYVDFHNEAEARALKKARKINAAKRKHTRQTKRASRKGIAK